MRKLQMLTLAWMCLCIPCYLFGQIYHEHFTGQEGQGAFGPMNAIDLSEVDWTLDLSEVNFEEASQHFKVVEENGEYFV